MDPRTVVHFGTCLHQVTIATKRDNITSGKAACTKKWRSFFGSEHLFQPSRAEIIINLAFPMFLMPSLRPSTDLSSWFVKEAAKQPDARARLEVGKSRLKCPR